MQYPRRVGNKHVFYRSGVYFFADSNSTYKHFFAHQLKEKQQPPMNFKGTAVSAITLHMHAFSLQQTAKIGRSRLMEC